MTQCGVQIDTQVMDRAKSYVVPKSESPTRVLVALSGGVDSAVAAWLLKEAGHEVMGVTLRLAPDDSSQLEVRHGRCCSADDMTDARQLCERLDIPFYAIDARDRFFEEVFQPFVQGYRKGVTPIPCLACNHVVKFGDLLKTAQQLNAKLATGHYANVVMYQGVYTLGRPLDRNRDQTYYLYGTDPGAVSSLMLPLGDLDKPFVRGLAARMGLAVAHKPDSQEICFVPDGDHARVVEDATGPLESGNLLHVDGPVLRTHDGIHRFTIGQRRGIKVGTGEKLYVVDVNPENQQVVVGRKEDLNCKVVEAGPLRAMVPTERWPEIVHVQVRARHRAAPATWELAGEDEIRFSFLENVDAVAPGQAAVVYDGDTLLGGGLIRARCDGRFPRRLVVHG
jgi:tRNA-uridine 2-sulfurtransferase